MPEGPGWLGGLNHNLAMSVRWWMFVTWALVVGSAVAWALKLFVVAPPLPARTPVASSAALARGDLTRLFGADAPPPVAMAAPEPAADARFQLIGVVNPRSSQAAQEGLALIAVDGKPAKAFRVGSRVDGDNVLQSVAARGATLGPRGGAALVALRINPPEAATTGTLPAAGLPAGVPTGLQRRGAQPGASTFGQGPPLPQPQMPQLMQQQNLPAGVPRPPAPVPAGDSNSRNEAPTQ